MSEHQSQSGEAVRCSAVVRHQDQEYQPEMWTVRKDDIYAAISAVESGIEYAQMCLSEHDKSLGRTTLKNKTWAEHMESDLRQMANAHKALRLMPNKSSSAT